MCRRFIKSGVKSHGSTVELHSILVELSTREVSGIPEVRVKSVDIGKNTSSEGGLLARTDAEMRKLGEQTGLDTLVVLAVNDEH